MPKIKVDLRDPIYHDDDAARAEFSEKELVDLTLLITTINAWNRLSIGFRVQHPNDRVRQAA